MNIPKTMGAQGMTFSKMPRGVSVPKEMGPDAVRGAIRKKLQGAVDGDHARGPGGGALARTSSMKNMNRR